MNRFSKIILMSAVLIEAFIPAVPAIPFAVLISGIITPVHPVWLFLSGLLFDLMTGRVWGLSCIYFLTASMCSFRYQQKFHTGSLVYHSVFLAVFLWVHRYLYYQSISVLYILSWTAVGILILQVTLNRTTAKNKWKQL